MTAKELSTLKERTQRRIQRMRKSRLRLLEAWFGTTKDRTNASIAQKLGQKPRTVMALTRRTITECKKAAATLWETAKRRADDEWGPACHQKTVVEGVKTTLGATEPETFSATEYPEVANATQRLLPLILHDVLDRSCRYGVSANEAGRAWAEAIRKAARRPRQHSFLPIEELLQAAGIQPGTYARDVIRWTGYETSGDHAVVRNGNRPRIQMLLTQHPNGLTLEAIAEATGIPVQRVNETLRNDPQAVRSRPGRWTLDGPGTKAFTNASTAIRDIITQAGGTATKDKIAQELERRYGIRPRTTQTLTKTRDFRTTAEGIEINPAAEAWSGELGDRASGFSNTGEPYIDWHASGNRVERGDLRIHDIPEVVAHHAGTRPNTSRRLKVTSPPGMKDITLTWSTSKQSPITLRRAGTVLRALQAKQNDLIRITFSREGTIALQNLGEADRCGQPDATQRPKTYGATGSGPASRLLTKQIGDVLARRRWAIHTAAARLGIGRHVLYNLLNGAETTVDRAETTCRRMGIEMRIGVGGPAGRSFERTAKEPVQPASARLREHLQATMRRHPGSSQNDIGSRLGVRTSWIQATLKGNVPRLDRAHRLAKALGATVVLGGAVAEAGCNNNDRDEDTSAGTTGPVTGHQQALVRNAASTLETRPKALQEPGTADGIPAMEETGYLAGHIVRNDPESRRQFNREMGAVRKNGNPRYDPDDPDIVNGTVIDAATTALDVAVMPVLFLTRWPRRWARQARVNIERTDETWTPDAEATRAVLLAVADGRIDDAFQPWWTEDWRDDHKMGE